MEKNKKDICKLVAQDQIAVPIDDNWRKADGIKWVDENGQLWTTQ